MKDGYSNWQLFFSIKGNQMVECPFCGDPIDVEIKGSTGIIHYCPKVRKVIFIRISPIIIK